MSVFPADERRAIRRILPLLKVKTGGFIGSVAAGASGLISSVCLAAVSAWLITRASQMPPVLVLGVATTAVRFFGVSKAVLRYVNRIFSHRVTLYGMSHLRSHVYSTLAQSPTDVITSLRRGDLLARTGRDVDSVGDLIVKALQPACVAVVVCITSCLIVGILSPAIGVVLFLCLLLSGVVAPYFAMRGGRRAEESQVRDRSEISSQALTLLDSATELRVSGRLTDIEKIQRKTEERIFTHRDGAARPQALAVAIDTIAMGIVVVCAIIIGSQQLAAGTLSQTALAVCVLTPLAAFEATMGLGESAIQLVTSAKAAQRILELLDKAEQHDTQNVVTHQPSDSSANDSPRTDPSHSDSSGSVSSGTDSSLTAPSHSDSSGTDSSSEPSPRSSKTPEGLIIDRAVLGWPGHPDISEPLSFTIPPSTSLGIVGPSGIGKSTLLFTLAGMLPAHQGTVRYNGRDIATIPREEVSEFLILTAEDAHIFETTVLENLRVANPHVTEREAVILLHKTGLGSWLAELPDGVHTMLGEDAATISGGERRRLLLARALASGAQYLLLDEPGEHLDPKTADLLIRDLLRAGKDPIDPRTIIVVTHRISPLDEADNVIVLEKNDNNITYVKDYGTHENILRRNTEYAWSIHQENA
ncbi:amino acid ABC transporter ATP-binding/permease protein [Actinotignum urinale]|uniref:Thiol reductant ABC exporter subunit CydC n=1 Tax=Actinotignum urinale TaxID=190146 RepID=A0ABU5G815_9ACTO|nr:thiol reductant ABC exporter subunit CydC [Actinotignum urinale]MDY5133476.1 thiol reductant ABC exporter subunit CydC [Actinotignum urinale]